jgi:hypothetical protein
MPFLAISGADAMTGFRFDVSAAMGLVVSGVVIIAFARDCFGRSRAAMFVAALLLVVDVAFGCAAGPIEFIALWQLQWFLASGLSLFFGDEDAQAWLGRLLMAGWLFDAVLIAGTVALARHGTSEEGVGLLRILAWGSALSLAARVAALPVGAHAAWNDRPLRPAIAWILIATIPPATVLGFRLIELLDVDSTSRLGVCQFLGVVAMAAALTSLKQESAIRETAWRISAFLAGIATVSLMVPAWPGRVVWMIAAIVGVVFGRRLSDAVLPRRQFAPANDFLGRLEATAAREWNVPRVWRFGVAMPVRGVSQVLRFLDGFLFEQVPAQAFRRLDAATAPVRQALPELFSRMLVATLLVASFVVLLALAFR